MPTDFDEADTNSSKVTPFDYERLIDLESGMKMDGELGNWSVIKYSDNSYVVLLHNDYNKRPFSEFTSIKDVVDFLNK